MEIEIGLSPCPNDTFIFDALLHGRIDTGPYQFRPVFADVEELNRMAQNGELATTKLSYHAFFSRMHHYAMMYTGGALGRGVGPLLVCARELTNPVHEWSVAIPGIATTANFLMDFAYPEITQKTELVFHEIEDAVLRGAYDAGVIIHENRFTYADRGLSLIADLGAVWERETGAAIPLGGIAIRRDLPLQVQRDVNRLIGQSVEYAQDHPMDSFQFVAEHAQEMEPSIREQHIDLYVNMESKGLTEDGIAAVEKMYEIYTSRHAIQTDRGHLFIDL